MPAVTEGLPPYVTLPFYHGVHPHREGIYYRNANPVQAAGNRVTARPEFAARMQDGHYYFDRGAFFGGMHIYRDSAAVIADPQTPICLDGNFDMVAIAGQSLVDGVVDYLVYQVVQTALPGRTDIHTGAFAYCL